MASYAEIYLHLVWGTWNRMPLVTEAFRQAIYGCIQDQARKHRCEVLAIGGMEDHVHLLLRFPTTARISEVVQHAKGASSHLMTQVLDRGGFFKWQGYYGAFTVAKSHVPRLLQARLVPIAYPGWKDKSLRRPADAYPLQTTTGYASSACRKSLPWYGLPMANNAGIA